MKIEYLGHSCFRLTTDKGVVIVTDPYEKVGYELPTGLEADIVTVSHDHFDHNAAHKIKSGTLVTQAGQTRLGEVTIVGTESWHDERQGALRGKNIVYTIYADGLTVCHLGDLGEPCGEDILARLPKADILLVPVGGRYTVDAAGAKEYVQKLAPKIAIPMHYKPKDGTIDIASAAAFLKLFDRVTHAKDKHTVVVEKDDLNHKVTEILFMERAKAE